MNREIEEMARVLNECCNVYDEQGNHIRNKCYECECWSDDNHCCCSYNSKEAEALYNAGYRKASDVARDIFGDIERLLDTYSSAQCYQGEVFVQKSFDYELEEAIAELRKKYESEGEE